MCSRTTETVEIFSPVDGIVSSINGNRMIITPHKNAGVTAPISGSIIPGVFNGKKFAAFCFRELKVDVLLVGNTARAGVIVDVDTTVGRRLMKSVGDDVDEIHVTVNHCGNMEGHVFSVVANQELQSGGTIIGYGNVYEPFCSRFMIGIILGILIETFILHL